MVSGYLFVPKQESGGVDDREKILCRGQEQACALGPKLHLNRQRLMQCRIAFPCRHVIQEIPGFAWKKLTKQESGGVDDREKKIPSRGQEQACALGPKLHLNRSAETCLHVL